MTAALPREGWVFLFPGQGSQQVGMGADLAEVYPEARATFEEADACLGFSLSRLMFEGPAERLTLTANAQPALLTVSVAAARVLEKAGIRPAAVAGHSLGEYSALVAAGALSFPEALRLVRLRGEAMEAAVPAGRGGMGAVIGLGSHAVAEICREASDAGLVEPANFNGPGQIVVSGEIGAVRRALELARERGASRTMELPVSGPFHSSLMQPAAERLAAALKEVEIRDPAVPVVANVSGEPVAEGRPWPELLVRQVASPVLWERGCRHLLMAGHTRFLEVGPGRVLAGLLRRIARESGVGGPELVIEAAGDRDGLAKVLASVEGDTVR